jgi:hypothetical protein
LCCGPGSSKRWPNGIRRWPGWCSATNACASCHHRLALIHIPGLPLRDPDAVGTDHVAYAYNNLGELLSTYRRLKAVGIVPHWPINHGVTTSMYYRDPDNNRVELQIDNFPTPAELDGYFHSRAFAENPVGVTYDPEELCRRYEAGEAMAD